MSVCEEKRGDWKLEKKNDSANDVKGKKERKDKTIKEDKVEESMRRGARSGKGENLKSENGPRGSEMMGLEKEEK